MCGLTEIERQEFNIPNEIVTDVLGSFTVFEVLYGLPIDMKQELKDFLKNFARQYPANYIVRLVHTNKEKYKIQVVKPNDNIRNKKTT